jgi:hypothetical protein
MKSRSFKLVKEFPLSPKLGTVVTFETETEFFDRLYNSLEDKDTYQLKDCVNHPEFWEEVVPKFKVGDIIVDNTVIKRIGKIDFIKKDFVRPYAKCKGFLSPFVLDNCKKADNDQIITYHEDLGWKKGVKFKILNNKDFSHIYTVLKLDVQNNVYVEFESNGQIRRFIINKCELLPEYEITKNKDMKVINVKDVEKEEKNGYYSLNHFEDTFNLSQIEKYLLNNNWEFREEDYGLEFYIKLALENELVYWDNELSVKSPFEEEIIIMLNPTINQIENLIKILK